MQEKADEKESGRMDTSVTLTDYSGTDIQAHTGRMGKSYDTEAYFIYMVRDKFTG